MKKNLEKYNCPICQCILDNPVTLRKCFHEFCLKCINTYIQDKIKSYKPITCPLCRKHFNQYDYVIATDLQIEIENCKIQCECGKFIPIRIFEDHQDECKNKNNNKDGTISGNYNCTLCPKKYMNRKQYVEHIHDVHSNEEGVCAICSVQPWGDKNYKTYLLGHVDLRHKKEITKNDNNLKELELLKKVLELSLVEK